MSVRISIVTERYGRADKIILDGYSRVDSSDVFHTIFLNEKQIEDLTEKLIVDHPLIQEILNYVNNTVKSYEHLIYTELTVSNPLYVNEWNNLAENIVYLKNVKQKLDNKLNPPPVFKWGDGAKNNFYYRDKTLVGYVCEVPDFKKACNKKWAAFAGENYVIRSNRASAKETVEHWVEDTINENS